MQIVVLVAKALFVMMVVLMKVLFYFAHAALMIVGALLSALPSKPLTPEEEQEAQKVQQKWRQREEDELRQLNLDYARKRQREMR